MSVPDCPGFSDWYRSIHNRDPFPWQSRLAQQVAETGEWPELIGIPTGLGKTACLDIAVWALASQADRDPRDRTVPTRIWWVVNRRILVDDTYRHALMLEALLADPETSRNVECDGTTMPVGCLHGEAAATVQAVADRLRHLSGMGSPLQACRLRGGDSHNRPRHPAQPAIICSTIPMYGSRVLFRGYGSSRSMRPIDAALAGVDSLVLLDEAHLAQPLRLLLDAISGNGSLGAGIERALPDQRMSPVVVALTATGETSGSRFDLDEADRDHDEIAKRLEASKPLSIADIAQGDPARPIATATKELLDTLDTGSSYGILVFANTPKTALSVAKALRSRRGRDCDIVVATGRTRGVEAGNAIETIEGRMKAGQPHDPAIGQQSKHLVVVATQTLEVGADLDADYLVTEACGFRALTQRLGRLNRLGNRSHARGVYVHVEPKDKQWPVYGDEPATVLEQLQAASGYDEAVDMSPGNIGKVLGDSPPESADAPVLAEALLWEWVKTSIPPPGEAPVEPYFSGTLEADLDVQIVWRGHVPKPGQKVWPRVSSEETVSVHIGEAWKELVGVNCVRVGSDQATAEQIAVGDNGSLILRPGDTIVVACEAGKLDPSGHWNPVWNEPALDASILDNGLVISDETLSGMYGTVPDGPKAAMADLVKHLDPKTEAEPADVFDGTIRLCDELEEYGAPPSFSDEEWAKFLQGLRNGIDDRGIRHAVVEPAGEAPRLPVYSVDRQHDGSQQVSFDEFDELSIADPVSLEAHGDDVARTARLIADAIGVTPSTASLIEAAARIHDIGKADTRFQNWLDPEQGSSTYLAKSEIPRSRWEHGRAAAGWPSGGRHEELSRRLAFDWLAQGNHDFGEDEQKLLLHLVVAHHGHGRPLVTPVEDLAGTKVAYQIDGRDVIADANLSDTDWEQPARFASLNKLYGCWGLALLEAIVRQADHLVSAAAETALEIR